MRTPIKTLAFLGLLCIVFGLKAAAAEKTESSNVQMDASGRAQLPRQGTITYRVGWSDSNLEVGQTSNEWKIDAGRYHLRSVAHTTGLARLLKSMSVVMESHGQVTPEGLRPDTFVVREGDKPVRQWAKFDWKNMKVHVGEQPEQTLQAGSQDVLSFNYNFGFMPDAALARSLFVATGKKYRKYSISFVAREEIEVPAGKFKTLHVRTPGENTTELWLAYDYWLLPVKVRHIDKKGNSFVQVATRIHISSEAKD